MYFLQERKQLLRVRNNNSSCHLLQAGTPQGTLSGPNNFKLLTNDSHFDKHMDDTTVVSVSTDPNDQSL